MSLISLITGFLRLIRFPNLLFIALTQILLQYCIYQPLYNTISLQEDTAKFWLLCAASLLIAAAGYVINDYFDADIDQVNKPARLIIGKLISKRVAIFFHLFFSATGILLTYWSLHSKQQLYLVFLNGVAVLLLWFYSVRFKKSFLIGNLIISLLVAWVIIIFFLSKLSVVQIVTGAEKNQTIFYQLTILYAGFAFLSTFIRELIKDVEDLEGDRRYGCKTLPILWGIPLTRLFIFSWVVVQLVLVFIVMVYLLQLKMRFAFLYGGFFIVGPLLLLLKRLHIADNSIEFGKLSSLMKWVLLAGILSMIFFYIR